MNAVSGVQLSSSTRDLLGGNVIRKPPDAQMELKEKFQDFVAGTFFRQMLKALHGTHDKAAYFHGGQAEQIFQGQFDQYVAEDLARHHGGAFADQLYNVFSNQLRARRRPTQAITEKKVTETNPLDVVARRK